ncbi:MAG: hypothetical protein NVS3B19_17810 [Ginsengibacter sp.]
MTQIRQVKNASMSHNGRNAVFTVTSIAADENAKGEFQYHNQLWIVPTDGSEQPRALTNVMMNSTQAAWSPDDTRIAFVRAVNEKSQIFLMDLKGGEPIQLTNEAHGASAPVWSPDGTNILYSINLSYGEMVKDSILNPGHSSPFWSLEKPGFKINPPLYGSQNDPNGNINEIRNYLTQDEADKKVKVFNKLNFEGESATEQNFLFNHIAIISTRPGSKERHLSFGFNSITGACFTADGKEILFVSASDSSLNPDRSHMTSIYSIPVNGGLPKLLIAKNDLGLSNIKLSPSGRFLFYQSAPEMTINVAASHIHDFTQPSKEISIPLDRSVSEVVWSKDSKSVYICAQSNGGVPIYKYTLQFSELKQLTNYDEGLSGLDVGLSKLVYSKTAVANPSELFVADLDAKNEKRISSFNVEWLKDKKLSFPEKKYYKNTLGETVEYWIMKPTNYLQGIKYPVMLQIHGGPAAMWGPGEFSMWHEFQYFCGKGYGVVYSNPRGSGGYGIDFLKANYRDWGTGPTEDVMGALNETLAEGWGDSSKEVVTGGSYAGYLTGWIVGHTKRFAAASSQRGVYDLATFFGEGNAWKLVPQYFGGYPWEDNIRTILQRESPFTYVNNITTPYLILHGENDLRTGIVQGEMMYKALKVLNRPVEYVQHPGGTHELVRSGNVRQRIDQMLRIYEFFERFIIH